MTPKEFMALNKEERLTVLAKTKQAYQNQLSWIKEEIRRLSTPKDSLNACCANSEEKK